MPVLIALALAVLYLAFGYAVSRAILRLQWGIGLLCMAAVLGVAVSVLLTNTLGYLFPIQQVFWMVPVLMLFSTLSLTIWKREMFSGSSDGSISRFTLLALGFIILFCGLSYARDGGSDLWTPAYLSVPAEIMEGGFPIRDPVNPWNPYNYHYAPALVVAHFSFLTGLSVMSSYVWQPLFAVAGIVLGAGALAWQFSRSRKAVVICGALALLGAGLFWIQGVWLLRDLFTHYVLGEPIVPASETVLRWLTPTIRLMYAQSLLPMLGHRAIAMGVAFLFPILFSLSQAWASTMRREAVAWTIVAFILALDIALCLETSLVLLLGSLVVFPVLQFLFVKEGNTSWKKVAFLCTILFIFVSAISLIQGGVLSVRSGDSSVSSFAIGFDGRLHIDGGPEKDTIALWEWRFVRDFGPYVLLFILSCVWAWKRRRTSPFLLFIGLLAAMHFVLPLFVQFVGREHEMNRFFFVAFGVSSILIGLYLWDIFFASPSRFKRYVGIMILACLLMAGSLNAAVKLAFPSLRLETRSFFPKVPSKSAAENDMYQWIQANTNLSEYFYLHSSDQFPSNDRVLFSYYTGRYVIDAGYERPEETTDELQAIENSCSKAAIQALQIRYLVLLTEDRLSWFRQTCNQAEWEQMYEDGVERVPRLYRIRE